MSDDANALARVYLVRHGETEWSLSRQLTGRADISLTARGEQDARALAPQLREIRFAQVLVSPLLRARQTANLAGFGARAQPDPDLMEWDYGTYQGRRAAEIQVERPGWNLFEHGCPEGETLSAVGERADKVVQSLRAVAGDVLVFAHRDILRVVIARWLRLPPLEARRFYLDTASLSILGYQHNLDEPVVRLLNGSGR